MDNKQTLAEAKKAAPGIARIEGKLWSGNGYEDAAREIPAHCQAAVTVISQSPFESGEGYELEPQLYNPVSEKECARKHINSPCRSIDPKQAALSQNDWSRAIPNAWIADF